MAVEFQDFSFEVKAELNDITRSWLRTWANEIASHAKDNTQMDGDQGVQLRKSYRADVDEGAGVAQIGTPLESGYWEEYGTGEYAVHGDGRKGWWVWKDGYQGSGGRELTEQEAKAMAARDPTIHATNGREPSYTLEKAFTVNKPKAIADLEQRLRGMDG